MAVTSDVLLGKVEVREDEEQNVKFHEIVDLFLAAGYFRARIKGLSPFDKVVGGMTWCIEACNFDVDVDFLFHDNLIIGQKIALTEKIVAVLPKMKCPHRLEPHQIQGLDFIHIFPAVQWLVKKVIETREEQGDYIRSYAISQFKKSFQMPEDAAFEQLMSKGIGAVNTVLESYGPKRRYRRQDAHKLIVEKARVQSTLLEYGRQHGNLLTMKHDMSEDNSSTPRHSSTDSNAEGLKDAGENISVLMSSMSATKEHEKLAASVVGSIIGLQSTEIQHIASEYTNKQFEIHKEGLRGEFNKAQQHQRVVASLARKLTQQSNELEELEKQHRLLLDTCEQLQVKLQESQQMKQKMEDEMKMFETMETGENGGMLLKLRSLVALNENLKKQEREFRSHCKEELGRLQNNIDELKSSHGVDSDDKEYTELIEKQYEKDKEKLQKLRLLLARKSREAVQLQRKIDDVPSRTELSQYQQRFVELYSLVAAKHKETKQFYTLYNTLDDTKLYLAKEVNLLNSIMDTFTEAMSSPHAKEQFLKQFEQIVEGTNQNKIKLEKRKQEEKMRRDQLNDTYLNLIEQQRSYFKTVKEFKEECRKNEVMLAKLKGVGQ